MNANHTDSNLIFRDQLIAISDAPAQRATSLTAACQDQSEDYLDVTLRAFLVLCMVTALLICGWNVTNAETTNTTATAQPVVAAQSFSVNSQHTF